MDTIFNVELHLTYPNEDKRFHIFPCVTFKLAMRVVNEILAKENWHKVDDDVELPIIRKQENGYILEIFVCEDKIISCDKDVKDFVDY